MTRSKGAKKRIYQMIHYMFFVTCTLPFDTSFCVIHQVEQKVHENLLLVKEEVCGENTAWYLVHEDGDMMVS